ncbi:MAG: asparagine synthase (glutamine-hydrolyzing) [Gemmatimonadota bacterium]|nr:asparagine synthase (glutamine-hydrolyzing) [Gemmatimonadota bacterium]
MVTPGRPSTPADRALLDGMTNALAHRGPDARGAWQEGAALLGHTRLSIIDLSVLGCQPMHDDSGRYVMVYNGEVYNYLELRAELVGKGHRFRSATDSEVVLHAFREWGPSALSRFNGMWAIAIWDRQAGELFAARDRAGKKPFYHATDDEGTFYFASEIKSLRAAGLSFGLDPQAAFDFLTQGTYGHLGAQGFFSGVQQLLPGHYLRVAPGEPARIARYWDLPVISECDRLPYDSAFRDRFRDLFTDAVRIRLRADVPVGATLSGGLDSSTIVAIVDEVTGGRPLHLFTSLYPNSRFDETPYFDAVVDRLRTPIVHRVVPNGEGWRDQLVRVLDHQEEPFGDTSIFAHYSLMEAARAAGVPVVLSGQGGDELLLGYPSMVNAYLGHLLQQGHLIRVAREIALWSRGAAIPIANVIFASAGQALPLPLRDRLRAQYVAKWAEVVSPSLREVVSLLRFTTEPGRSSFDSYLAQVFKRFAIPHLTHYDDRNAMAFSVEGRMPFLDYRVIELLSTVEYDALYRGGFTKRVLREAFGDLLPGIVRLRQDKIGFHTPMAAWLRREGEWIADFMTFERITSLGVLDPVRFASSLRELRTGQDRAALAVWRGFILHLWADRFEIRSTAIAQPRDSRARPQAGRHSRPALRASVDA